MKSTNHPASRILTCALLAFLAVPSPAEEPKRPNIVLIMTDDQGYGDLGHTGNPVLKTAHLDKLAAESSSLTDYHVLPTCSPTRAALLTGRWADRTGVWHTVNGRSMLRENEVTLGQMLKDAGYATGLFGKWHLGDNFPYRPEDRGFTEVYRHGGGGVGQTPDLWDNSYFDGSYYHNGRVVAAKGFCTDVFFSEAKRFIRECAAKHKPFFAYLTPNAPHGPLHAPRKYMDLYADQPPELAAFFGMIHNIDDNVGALRELLRELGIEDDTLFIFTTDNGTARGGAVFNAGMRGTKGSEYEGGHRVPFIAHWPAAGWNRKHSSDILCHAVDIVPTLLDLCGAKKPDEVKFDGRSIQALLDPTVDVADWPHDRMLVSDSQRVRDPVKWKQTAVMSGKWRLVNGTELYDIASDPGQKSNVITAHPGKAAKMRSFYDAWWAELEPTFSQSTAITLGHPEHPDVNLTAHDWIQEELPPWSQQNIRAAVGLAKSAHQGHWLVEVVTPGNYTIRLRRWPVEVDRPITAALPAGENVPGATLAFRAYPGKAIPVTSAVLRLDGKELASKPVVAGDHEIVFTTRLAAGAQQLAPVFRDDQGNEIGAYYATVTLSEKPNPDCVSKSSARSAQQAASTEWWREAKFGMFIHWGLYAEPARGEWVMLRERIPIAEYKKLAANFNPVKFNAAEWVAVAKAAGMKYITITSKHHDGFALFDSDASDFNIVDATPFKRDVIRELSEACAKEGIKFGVYYSQAQDWSHPGGSMAPKAYWDPAQVKGKEAFEEYLRTISIPQIKEVIGIAKPSHIWFDTPIGMDASYGREIVQAIRGMKPDTLLNSRLLYHGFQVEALKPDQLAELKDVGVDFLSYRDRSIPAETFAGWEWETCMTLNDSWGFTKQDHSWKSPTEVVKMLSQVASKGGNFLLNFGPTAEGEIPPAGVAIVKQVGDWLRVNGEAIYGTCASDLKKTGALASGPGVNADGSMKAQGGKGQAHGVADFDWLATARPAEPGVPAKIYLHVFKWPAGPLEVKGITGKVGKAYLLGNRTVPLSFSQRDGVFSVTLPNNAPDPIASVVCLEWTSE